MKLSRPGTQSAVAAAEELALLDLETPLDLEAGPVFRLWLAALSPTSNVLLFSLPALCADRRSLHDIARELSRRYAAPPEETPAGEPPIQYADYAQWQEELRSSDEEASLAGREHWCAADELGAEAAASWRTIPRNPGEPAVVEFRVPAAAAARIDALCRSRGVSSADFLLACWQVLLARATGDSVGFVRMVQDGRSLEELEHALGLFAAALPAALRVEPTTVFSEAVAEAAGTRLRNEEWQEYFEPAEGASSRPDRAPAGFEFFERPSLTSGSGISFSILSASVRVDSFPLEVVCERDGDSIRVVCASDPSETTGPSGAWIAAHLEALIAGAAENPDERAAALPLLPDSARRRLLVDLNRTTAEFPSDRTLHELFETQVERSPDSTALVFEGMSLTYRELNARANALAWLLRERGIGPDVAVGLGLERSAEMIVALLGIWKGGGAYVPLVTDHPPARLAQLLSQSGCRLLITDSHCRGRFAGFDGETFDLDAERTLLEAAPTGNPPASALPSSLAYVMYTSGSTGTPKGVAVRHESLVNYAHFIARDLLGIPPVSPSPLSFATVSTIGADLGNTAIFPALITGGCLHVIPYETAMDGGRFEEYCSRHAIDVLKIVPSHLSALLSTGGAGVLPRRTLILGGEALPWDLVDRIRSGGGKAEIANHYGPTETTIGSLTFRVPAREGARFSPTVPIGRPIANTKAFVLDSEGEPVPMGVAGELFIGGAGVAAGYRNLSGETAERFVPDVFPGSSAGRLYRTGDRVRYLPDGNLEFLGRVDDQVKIRGFRIEPGEVSSVLASYPKVREAVVIVREDVPGDRRLVAYFVPDRAAVLSMEDMRAWIRGRLPDYMVPSAIVSMKSIPLTANGKVDRRALPAPGSEGSHAFVAPRTPSETIVAETWKEVLRVERVGAEDDFFELGGHSLLLTQVVSRLRRAFERDLPIRWVFETPTVAGLARRIDAARREDLALLLDEIEEHTEKESPLSEIENEPPFRA
ncbi:MAG: amino acid adenylation domain-containing protein [Acidobacteriota bacterium]|nr:amino acid adenylation domain-containing protein [Acidobacteriota bacterium]